MLSFRLDPYIWIHVAGLAIAPIFLEFAWMGFALAGSLTYLEFILLAAIGLIPIFWMQWNKPFNIYSLLFWCLKPEELTIEQRKVLSLYKLPTKRLLTLFLSAGMLLLLWLIYKNAPLASSAAQRLFPSIKLLGLLMASLSFVLANLFIQVALSTLAVLLTSKKALENVSLWETENISRDFTCFGWKLKKIVPNLK